MEYQYSDACLTGHQLLYAFLPIFFQTKEKNKGLYEQIRMLIALLITKEYSMLSHILDMNIGDLLKNKFWHRNMMKWNGKIWKCLELFSCHMSCLHFTVRKKTEFCFVRVHLVINLLFIIVTYKLACLLLSPLDPPILYILHIGIWWSMTVIQTHQRLNKDAVPLYPTITHTITVVYICVNVYIFDTQDTQCECLYNRLTPSFIQIPW